MSKTYSLTRDQVRELCPSCADAMLAANLKLLKLQADEHGELLPDDPATVKLFAGFSQGLCDKFGEDDGFFTRCAEAMSDEGLDDYRGFCAALHKVCIGKWPGEKKEHTMNIGEVISYEDLTDEEREYAEDEGDGVWRTVNGRRVFIRKGESAKEAFDRDLKGGKDKGGAKEKFTPTPEQSASAQKALDGLKKDIATGNSATPKSAKDVRSVVYEWMDAAGFPTAPGTMSPKLRFLRDTLVKGLNRDLGFSKGKKDLAEDSMDVHEYSNVIKGVEIFSTGTHNGDQYTEKDLEDMVVAFNELDYSPAIKVGHTKDEPGAPSYGWVRNLRRVGEKLYADFEDMHDSVVDALRKRSYDRVSSEIYFNLKRGTKTFRRALKAVALLGAEVPAVANLTPLHKMQFTAEGFDAVAACEQSLEVPAQAVVDALAERVSGLVNLIKEYDMAKNAEQIKALKAQCDDMKKKMDEMKKKKGKMNDDEMMDDEEYKQLAAQVSEVATKVADLEAEDSEADEVAQLQEDLKAANKRADEASAQTKALAERMAKLEQKDRNEQIGQRVRACKIPAMRPALEGIYAYALSHAGDTVKVFATKDGKTEEQSKSIAEVVDDLVTEINKQTEKLFTSLAATGHTVREDGVVQENAGIEVNKRVSDYRMKNPTVKSYQDAMTAVLHADPELAKRYREQSGLPQ